MTDLSVPVAQAKQGVQIGTNQTTHIQIRMASLEILVGGPYPSHPYGHTALRVTTSADDRIYDYGRYRATWGIGNSQGEGILYIWKNFQAYIKKEISYKRITTGFLYEITEEKANEINKYYSNKIRNKKEISNTEYFNEFQIEDYDAINSNCTTLSISGAKVAVPEIDKDWKKYQDGRGLSTMEKGLVSVRSWPNYTFLPRDLKAMLETIDLKNKKVTIYQ